MLRLVIMTILAGLLSVVGVAANSEPLVLDLRSASQLAIRTNPHLGSASAAVDVSRAGVGKARSALRPALSIQSGYSYLSNDTVFGTTPIWKHNTLVNTIAVQQIVYSGGKLEAGVSAAGYALDATSSQRRAAQAQVLAGVATAYFRARQAGEGIQAARDSLKSLQAGYDAATKLRDAGVVSKTDVLRAEVALASAKASLIAAENNRALAVAVLKSAVGLRQDVEVDLPADAADKSPDAADSAEPAQRPEVDALAAAVLAADAAAKAAGADTRPVVAVSADFHNEPEGSQFPRQTNTLLLGVSVKYNVLDGGLSRSGIAEAKAVAEKARQELESGKQQVEMQQRTALMSLASAKARVEVTASQVESARESLRALSAGYKEGITPLTDVLSAESVLTSATVDRLSALYDVKIAQVNLLWAYGLTDVLAQ